MPYGILGVNKRYLKYIKPLNPKKEIKLADSKLKTKKLLQNLDIPHPRLLDVIKSRKQLQNYDFSKFIGQDFVVKPNKGSKGKGIMICKVVEVGREERGQMINSDDGQKIEEGNLMNSSGKFGGNKGLGNLSDNYQISDEEIKIRNSEGQGLRKKGSFLSNIFSIFKKVETNKNHKILIKTGGQLLTEDEFKKHLADILDGKYSLTVGNDIILIEEKIEPSDEFKIFCKYGLADIRLIVMNLVPIMAMLRYPTKESKGKANIAAGGIGFGIDIASGKIVSMYKDRKIYVKKFPGEYKEFYGKTIPYWDDILLYSSQVQYFTNIGYLGLDWTIAKTGPNLIEINARAGMEIQLVNAEGLEKRLHKVEDLKVTSPSKGVEIGKTLFSKTQTNPAIQKDIIYLQQPGVLKVNSEKGKENSESNKQISSIQMPVTIKVDLDNKFNYADPNLISDFDKAYTLKFENVILDDVKFRAKEGLGNVVTLGTKTLDDFIIVPKKKDIKDFSIWEKDKYLESEEAVLAELDDKLDKLSKKLNISKIIKPKNYMEELDNFITWNGNYNPKFEYKYPSDKKLQAIEDDLKDLEEKYFDIKSEHKSELLTLFKEKFEELKIKLNLIKAYKNQNFSEIGKYNRLLYGELDNTLLNEAKLKINPFASGDLGRKLFLFEVLEKVRQHLKQKGINAQVVLETDLSSRILVRRGDPLVVAISKTAEFYEKEIDMILAHEIDVHVVRYLNGKKSGWKILQSGTGFYITDEEGLAIWNSLRYLPEGYEKNAMYEKYFLIQQAEKADFVHLANIIRGLHPNEGLLKIFRRTMRFKRGIQNTAFKGEGTAYFKDKIYLDGYTKVKKGIDEGGDFEKMLKGKYKIEDLKFINTRGDI